MLTSRVPLEDLGDALEEDPLEMVMNAEGLGRVPPPGGHVIRPRDGVKIHDRVEKSETALGALKVLDRAYSAVAEIAWVRDIEAKSFEGKS